ncbi:hypothetical protein MASR2M70_22400 [Bacillota bacterium]
MELLLDNLRNAIFKGKHGKIKDFALPDKRLLISIAITVIFSVLAGRSAYLNSMEAVSLALITVLVSESKAHIYALPFICLGMLGAGIGYDYAGDITALIICGFALLLPPVRRFPLALKALMAGAILVCIKALYYLGTGLLFLYDSSAIAMDLLILFGAVYVLNSQIYIIEAGPEADKCSIDPITIMSVVILFLVGGLGIPTIGQISVLNVFAFLIVLTTGYCMGSGAGGLAGIVCGFLVVLMNYETPALAGILGCCGAAAGFFMGKHRLLTGVCFAGIALLFGILKGFPGLYISIYEPLIAAMIFVLAPPKIMDLLARSLSWAKRDDSYAELAAGRKVKEQIKEYADLFAGLALSSSMRAYYPARDILAQQFKGMARALEKISKEITPGYRTVVPQKPRYSLNTAVASYAKEGRISGDSSLCTHINGGEFLLALSDGMGQGLRAAEESNFTVNSIYSLVRAGFEVELALRMVNSILLQKSNDEILSTLDMGLINLYTGRAKIYKIGAAAGFVKRGDSVKVIKMPALPLGIIEKLPVESISMQLKKEDMLIIVSDGVAEAERGALGPDWVKEVIQNVKSKDPHTMADLIINRAVQKYGLREKDDMTVLAALVK